jgi:hypothetical protein
MYMFYTHLKAHSLLFQTVYRHDGYLPSKPEKFTPEKCLIFVIFRKTMYRVSWFEENFVSNSESENENKRRNKSENTSERQNPLIVDTESESESERQSE